MTIDEMCRVAIPKTNADVKLTKPWVLIIQLHDHFQAYWPWPMPEKPNVSKFTPATEDGFAYLPPEEQERLLIEMSEAQVRAEKPWWDVRDSIVAFVGHRRVVSSWKPSRFSRVSVHYRLRCADTGELIWDTKQQGQAHHFTLGCGDVVPALDLAVRQCFTFEQEGFVMAKPAAGFGPYDCSLEAAKVFHKRFLDGFAFQPNYKSVFDEVIDQRVDRECLKEVLEPNDFDPAGEERRKEAQLRRAAGLPPDLSDLPKVEQVPECDPEFLLAPSSLDMEPWLKKYQNRHLVFEELKLIQVKKLPNETNFHTDEERVKFARRWKEIAGRFWKIGDVVRAYQCYFQANYILEPLGTRVLKIGPNEDDDCKMLRNKCIVNGIVCLGKVEDWSELEKVAKPFLARFPDHPKVLYWMARVEASKGNDIVAMDQFKRLINMDPANMEARRMWLELRKEETETKGAFSKSFVTETSLKQVDEPRNVPPPDWSEVEAAGFDVDALKAWGLKPTKTRADTEEEDPHTEHNPHTMCGPQDTGCCGPTEELPSTAPSEEATLA
eukprot:Gregarina_sp_Pseudo_9__1978@NODE_236_length_3474_cov_16_084716_g220_i0_p1_GENE_NODE_236_length_3474_cov_16_084716_g220_i0NODE_236_length_3474_cov_16_084716_g220_i0_p1_ORF_typecomplete_len647_score152_31FKBP_C/PF00254_28/7_4e03FKBP_C/PF00254_28/3_5e05TPR_15/PF13429_6/0_00034TPR_19/PF14559_6/0_017TPR_16/PF13432_6/0_022YfiO/PF13525_6/0_12ANAPC3/PF12895_7/0_5_NODE_236_length_3474_cov_16_084716_g220_i015333185